MSVVAATAYVIHAPFQSPTDLRLPLGTWTRQSNPTGDASVGSVTAVIGFAQPSTNILFPAYSLEWLYVETDDGASNTWVVVTVNNMSPDPARAIAGTNDPRKWHETLSVHEGIGRPDLRALALPHFMGHPIKGATEGSLQVYWGVNTNGKTYKLAAGGYYWSPLGIYLPGSLQRPGASLLELGASRRAGLYEALRSQGVARQYAALVPSQPSATPLQPTIMPWRDTDIPTRLPPGVEVIRPGGDDWEELRQQGRIPNAPPDWPAELSWVNGERRWVPLEGPV